MLRILLVEEYPERERLALLLLKSVLEGRGHSVLISNAWELELTFRAFQPGVVVDNISDSVSHFVGKLGMLEDRHRYINLIWEQLPNPLNTYRYRFEERITSGIVDGRICWGRRFSEFLCHENPGLDSSRVYAVGSMRHAVDQHISKVAPVELRGLYDYPFDEYKGTVLVADAFPMVNRDLSKSRDAWRTRDASPYLYEYLVYAREMRRILVAQLHQLAENNRDYLFILRTHPSPDLDYHKTYERELLHPNIRLNYSGDIAPLLRVSDVLIASRSGTLIDAHFVGTPAVNLKMRAFNLAHTGVLFAVEDGFGLPVEVDDRTELELDELIENASNRDENRLIASQWIDSVEPTVFENAADAIEDVVRRSPLAKRLPLASYREPKVIKRALRNFLRYRGIGVKQRKWHPFDYDRAFSLL